MRAAFDDDCEADVADSCLTATVLPPEFAKAGEPGSGASPPQRSCEKIESEAPTTTACKPDIEHVFVQNDPRDWTRGRKRFTLLIVAAAAIIATLGINIYNPAINSIKTELHATDQEISLTLSVFILVQGTAPLIWSAVSEIQGRKFVYLVSIALTVVACGIAGSSRSIDVLIAVRLLQGFAGGAVLTVGAATLADIYEPRERGTVVGIYYASPLLGPSLGPFLGGLLTQFLNWRWTFYVAGIFAGASLLWFLLFQDTFRRERSMVYQSALLRHQRAEKRVRPSADVVGEEGDVSGGEVDCPLVRLSLRDVDPVTPLIAVMRRKNHLMVLIPSGLLFGLNYTITYTVVRTFAAPPYNLKALSVGLVLLSNGIGSMVGSVLGGWWSDHVLTKVKAANGGHSAPEDRLRSTKPMLLVLPLSLIAYAWMAQKKVHVAAVCVILFVEGVFATWVYSSSLAYIVDANVGRSSTAVASNSLTRGTMGFVAAEIAVPLQEALGDGGLYTIWAGVTVIVAGLLMVVLARGSRWREEAESREREREGRRR